MTRRLSLLNQIFKSLHAESADIDLAFAIDDLLRMRLGVATYSARSLSTTSRKVRDLPDFTYSLGICLRR